MIGAADLAEGRRWLSEKMGAAPGSGGRHPGQGTVNALLGLSQDCYLEVIAPDPDQSKPRGLAQALEALSEPKLLTFAVRCAGFSHLVALLDRCGFDYTRQTMSRETPSGGDLSWELLFVQGHGFGQLMPFFIDWQDSAHPCTELVPVGHSKRLSVQVDQDVERYRTFISRLDLPLSLELGVPGLVAELETSSGPIQL